VWFAPKTFGAEYNAIDDELLMKYTKLINKTEQNKNQVVTHCRKSIYVFGGNTYRFTFRPLGKFGGFGLPWFGFASYRFEWQEA